MILKLRKPTAAGVRGHGYANRPLINSSRLVLLEKRRGNERLEDKPAAKIDAEEFNHDR